MINYATLHQVKLYIGIRAAIGNDDDALLMFIDWASRFIEQYKGRRYDVRVETRKYDRPAAAASTFGMLDSAWTYNIAEPPLRLDDDLLEVSELLNGDETEILANQYVLEPANTWPKNRIKLRPGLCWVGDDNGYNDQVVQVTGIWGFHNQYDRAWIDSLDSVQDNPLTAGATTINVDNADGSAEDADSPRFQAGQLIRMGTEFALVLATDTTENTLTVKRGMNGTTAAQHAQGTQLEIWRPYSPIVQACVRLVKWRYSQKDTDLFDKSYVVGTGLVNVPTSVPYDVLKVLGAPKAEL